MKRTISRLLLAGVLLTCAGCADALINLAVDTLDRAIIEPITAPVKPTPPEIVAP